MKLEIFYLIVFAILTIHVNGNHFFGGTITWRPLNASASGSPIAIVITQTYSWSYSLMPCTQSMIASQSLVPNYASLASEVLECIDNCGAGATGYPNISVISYCTDFSVPLGTTVGQRSDTVYLQVNDEFTVAFEDSTWRPLATNANAGWSISTSIIVKTRSDNGRYNTAPVATVMSPINIPFNRTISIKIPVCDADGDILRCRWSTKSNGINECGGVCPPNSLPPNTHIYSNCTIIITGQNITDWFAITVMVEDFINSSSTIPLSSIPVQFLVYVINGSSCPILPEIIGIPQEQSCTTITVGQTFTSRLIARNNCASHVTIVDISTLSFIGMITSNLTQESSVIYYKTLTWTPTASQVGYQFMCAMAIDSENSQSIQYCFKFYVTQNEVCSCPGETCKKKSVLKRSINWPLIGSLVALILFATLTFCCCLRLYPSSELTNWKGGTIELYHIELCSDQSCQQNKTNRKKTKRCRKIHVTLGQKTYFQS